MCDAVPIGFYWINAGGLCLILEGCHIPVLPLEVYNVKELPFFFFFFSV
jgi:hypothetical protein